MNGSTPLAGIRSHFTALDLWFTTHTILTSSSKTRLLPQRVKVDYRSGLHVHVTNRLSTYFSLIRVPSHRLAYMRFITSNHRLAIEVLRWTRSGADYIPDGWRLCRFCQDDVEDEIHAFMVCGASPELMDARAEFRSDVFTIDPTLRLLNDPYNFMLTVLRRNDTVARAAKYLHTLHVIFTSTPVVVPPVDSYHIII
jgi:hypothetical protein